jgi:anti-sigma B factor antagonist
MNINRRQHNSWHIITIAEERLDAHNSQEFKEFLSSLFEEGVTRMVIDLSIVRFIDSSGLGALVSGFKNALSKQGELRLASLQPQVRSMFELTRLHRVFDIFPSCDDAVGEE